MKTSFASRLAVGMSLILSVTAVAIVGGTTNHPHNPERVRLENKTRSLIVESVKELGETRAGVQKEASRLEVIIRNGSDKPISAYRFRVSDSQTDKDSISGIERSGAMDGWALPPQGKDAVRLSVAHDGEVVLTMSAVLFEDGTGEGDSFDLSRLQEFHAGVRTAFQRIVPVLRQKVNADEAALTDTAIQSLEDEVALVNDEGVPKNSKAGFAEGKSHVGLELRDMKDRLRSERGLGRKAEIVRKLEKIEKALAKL